MNDYVGVDVSKACLDIDYFGKHVVYKNEQVAISTLLKLLKKKQDEGKSLLVVCEATGGYEQKLVRACYKAGIPVHMAHANKVRYFAKSKGLLAKTDKLDAQVLSEYGRLLQPEPDSILLNETTEKIRERLRRKEQLQADRKRELCRLDKELDQETKQSINSHIDWLSKEMKALDNQLAELKKSDDVNIEHTLLTSIPAIGDITAFYLLSQVPEIGAVSNKVIASLVGVAPFNHDSGSGQGKRFIQGGRSQIRRVLYMAAVTAIRFNSPLKIFYLRLRENGKVAKVAIVAVMRKLLTMANSVIKRKSPWTDEYQFS